MQPIFVDKTFEHVCKVIVLKVEKGWKRGVMLRYVDI